MWPERSIERRERRKRRNFFSPFRITAEMARGILERWKRLPRWMRNVILVSLLLGGSGIIGYKIGKTSGMEEGRKEEIKRILSIILSESRNIIFLNKLKGGEYKGIIYLKEIPREIEGKIWLGLLKLNNGEEVNIENFINEIFEEKKKQNPNLTEEKIKELDELKKRLLDEYKKNPGERISFNDFREFVRNCIYTSFGILDEEKLSKDIKHNERFVFFKQIINDEYFKEYMCDATIAIIMTELRLGDNGEENKKALEAIIKNFGLGFLTTIISIYDPEISYGPFQLTNSVVGSNENRIYPASYLRSRVKDKKNIFKDIKKELGEENFSSIEEIIVYFGLDNLYPNDIMNIKPEQHYFGETSLFVYYLIYLFNNLDGDQFYKIKELYGNDREKFCREISRYLSYCHNKGPAGAVDFFKGLINNQNNQEMNVYYTRIFDNNLEALRRTRSGNT
jgi:hypothetical protein